KGWPMIPSARRHESRQNGKASTAGNSHGIASTAPHTNGACNAHTNGQSSTWARGGQNNAPTRNGLSPAMQVSVLALNRSFAAVHVVSVQRAFGLLWKGKAEVIDFDGGHYMSYDFERWCENSQLKALEASDDTEDWIRAV